MRPHGRPLTAVIEQLPESGYSLHTEIDEAKKLFVIRADYEPNTWREYHLDPLKGFVLVRALCVNGGRAWIDYEAEYRNVSGKWFIDSLRFKKILVMGEKERHTDVTIKMDRCEINDQIDDRVFTLAGMGVPIGTTIVDYREKPPVRTTYQDAAVE